MFTPATSTADEGSPSMVTASYYREQAKILQEWAAAATDPAVAERFARRAQEYVLLAEALEAPPRPRLRPAEPATPVAQQQQQAKTRKESDGD